jgi:dipeptidyl-peptidase-4
MNWRALTILFLAGSFLIALPAAQSQQTITLEDIWQDYSFSPERVPGFNFQKDGKHYTRLVQNRIVQYDLTTGKETKVLFDAEGIEEVAGFNGRIDGYVFSDDESKILVRTQTESIYRRSSKSFYYVWDGKELSPLYLIGKQMYATFNPAADKVAFVYENNMYYKDLNDNKVVQITNDGMSNRIINGGADWVYEEEFSFAKAFQWSPDGQRIAYYRFDESRVKEFTMTHYRDEMYPEYETFKYPKVGEDNAIVSIHIYDLKSKKSKTVDVGEEQDQYIPRIKWTRDPGQLCVFRMNRHQNRLELLLANAKNGKTKLMLKEENKYYVDIHDNLTFLEDGDRFIWTSEMDGWNHIYLYNMKGKKLKQITSGKWEVTDFYGVDEKNGRLYYQSAEDSPMRRHVYSVGFNGKNKEQMTTESGYNSAQFSSTFDYYVNTHSTINTPPSYTVYNRSGSKVRTIVDNTKLRETQKERQVQAVEFFDFKTSEDVTLNGYMIKPPNFKKNREYPVFMFEYGGPGSQQVVDSWRGQNYWWFQMLAQQGYIIACVDNRGTGGRGEEFKKMTYLQMGKYETIDQIEAAKYLGGLKYVDENRIGIFGWSYGGYLSSLALLKGNDVFKAAIAVAPVTNWKWYDTIYTERYMRTVEENEEGYRQNSPVYFADRLKGNYLLVHGMGDDNVHFQHTAEMVNALVMANKQFDTYFYPNRNHGIYGGTTRLHLYQKMTDFLNEKLMNDTSELKKKP